MATGDTLLCTSLRSTLIKRIGFSTVMLVTIQRICGRQQMASSMFRAADGVITG
jgi:hypothetical protein